MNPRNVKDLLDDNYGYGRVFNGKKLHIFRHFELQKHEAISICSLYSLRPNLAYINYGIGELEICKNCLKRASSMKLFSFCGNCSEFKGIKWSNLGICYVVRPAGMNVIKEEKACWHYKTTKRTKNEKETPN